MFDEDDAIRVAAFAYCGKLLQNYQGAVPWGVIQAGFDFQGKRIFLGSTPRGIHRPAQMQRGILSIKTTKPKEGHAPRYNDEIGGNGEFSYAFQGQNPDSRDNIALKQAFEDQSPFIYFFALVPGIYQIMFPCYLTRWDPRLLRCTVAVGNSRELEHLAEQRVSEQSSDRRYSTIEAKVRLHQSVFREQVLKAYDWRCTITGLPIQSLLQAAHILPDRDERGRPEVTNGLCLSILHHTAYDQNLLGIDPDGIIHIAQSVLDQHDGPTLEMAIKNYNGSAIRLPHRSSDRPNRDYLAERFDAFQRLA